MMKKKTKAFILTAILLIIIGAAIGGAGFVMGGSTALGINRHGLYIPSYEQVSVEGEPLDDFTSIVTDIGYNNVKFVESDKNAYDMVYAKDQAPEITVSNGTLNIKNSTQGNITILNFGIEDSVQKSITIYYKKGTQFQNVDMSFDYCDVDLGNLSCTTKAHIYSGYGTITADGLTLPKSNIESMFSEFYLKNITADTFTVDSTYSEWNIEGFKLNNYRLESTYDELSFNAVKVKDSTDINLNYGEFTLTGELLGNTKFNSNYSETLLDLTSGDYSYNIAQFYSDVSVNGQFLEDDGNTSSTFKSNYTQKNNLDINLSYDEITLKYPTN